MFKKLVLIVLVLFICGCSSLVLNIQQKTKAFDKSSLISVLPFKNNTETPMVELRAASIVDSILKTKGFNTFVNPEISTKDEFTQEDIKKMIEQAKKNGVKYIVSGNINEWRYKIGMDAEPVVSLTIDIIDIDSNFIVWNAVGSMAGTGSDSLGITAQKLVDEILEKMKN